jgi:hypothetical protein
MIEDPDPHLWITDPNPGGPKTRIPNTEHLTQMTEIIKIGEECARPPGPDSWQAGLEGL